MNWNDGFTSEYYAEFVDPVTWRDIGRFEIIDGSVSRKHDDLKMSASFTCKEYEQGTENWVRLYLEATQNGETERFALFTGLATSPERAIEGPIQTIDVECYSVLKPADDILLDRGWYAPAESDGGRVIQSLLSSTPAPILVDDNAPQLQNAVIAEDSETCLSMVYKILTAINWRLRIDGDGTIHVTSQPTAIVASYDPIENDSIEPKLSVKKDWYSCPNVFRAIDEDLYAVARDDSPDSPYSTVNRGREVWMEETSCELNTNETIAEYAVRRLKDEQQVGVEVKYDRRYNPSIQPTDIIVLHYPEQGIEGTYQIMNQSISMSAGCKTSEEVTYYGG